jgi:hypothetical protein
MALVEQQCLDSYSSTVDYAAKRKAAFDAKLQKCTPQIVVFQTGDLVQVHKTEWVHIGFRTGNPRVWCIFEQIIL